MKTSLIKFYAVGLNEQNLAFDLTAFNNILQAGRFLQGNVERSITLNQPVAFGAPFQISAQNYYIFKKATYLLIQNTVDNRTYSRYGFINNFLELANGNYSVSYTLDDWANYILHASDLDVSPHIDGFTERANVPLIQNNKFKSYGIPLNAAFNDNGIKSISYQNPTRFTGHGIALPTGYKCAVYFISGPKYNGNASGAGQSAQGTILDYDEKTLSVRKIPRNNSSIYYMVFDDSGFNVGIYGKNNQNDAYTEIVPAGNITIYEPDDSTINKIMYFDFIPSDDEISWHHGFQQLTYNGHTVWGIAVAGTTENNLKIRLADITHVGNIYYKAEYIKDFAPLMSVNLISFTDMIKQNDNFTKRANYLDYINNSLYKQIDEFREITIKCLSAEIKISIANLFLDTKIIVGFSGDVETIFIKLAQPSLDISLRSNITSATGQNTAYFDLTLVRDFKAYKNAKLTGAAGIAATTVGSVVALGSSIATGNVAGVVGALSGGAQGVISGVQKLQGLTPSQQSPANGDKTLSDILNEVEYGIYIIKNMPLGALQNSTARYLEENGAAVSMPFDEYINNCQMESYNAVKCAYIDITGIPQQAARRIADAFISGLTLWTATDVGNKKVINYPAE